MTRWCAILATMVAAALGGWIAQPRSAAGSDQGEKPANDSVLVSLKSGRIVWLGPEGERDIGVTVGTEPGKLVTNRDETRAYVSVSGDVVAIDLAANSIVGRVKLSGGQSELALGGDGSRLYAVHTATASEVETKLVVSIIDTGTLKVVGQIPLADMVVSDAVITPDGRMLYVSHSYYAGRITVIDTARQAVVGIINLPGQSTAMGMDSDGRSLWATQSLEGEVVTIDTSTNQIVRTVKVGEKPSDIAPGFGSMVVNFGNHLLSFAGDGLKVREYPIRVAVADNYIYILHNDDNVATRRGFPWGSGSVALSAVPMALARRDLDDAAREKRQAAYDARAAAGIRRWLVWLIGGVAVAALGIAVGRRSRTSRLPIVLIALTVPVTAAVWQVVMHLAVRLRPEHLEHIYASDRPWPPLTWGAIALAAGWMIVPCCALVGRYFIARQASRSGKDSPALTSAQGARL